jgi:hypothetical protein
VPARGVIISKNIVPTNMPLKSAQMDHLVEKETKKLKNEMEACERGIILSQKYSSHTEVFKFSHNWLPLKK